MSDKQNMDIRAQLLGVTGRAARYCMALENVSETEPEEFVEEMLQLLPRIYIDFNEPPFRKHSCHCHDDEDGSCGEDCCCHDDKSCADDCDCDDEEPIYLQSYVDEDYYESIRRNIGSLLGPDDVFLETFEEDMKYSDTPIAASISESLADIFQSLYNFISIVKESDGDHLEAAYKNCREEFVEYWSQPLCNVLRALNHLRHSSC